MLIYPHLLQPQRNSDTFGGFWGFGGFVLGLENNREGVGAPDGLVSYRAGFPSLWGGFDGSDCFFVQQWVDASKNLNISQFSIFRDNVLNDHPSFDSFIFGFFRICQVLVYPFRKCIDILSVEGWACFHESYGDGFRREFNAVRNLFYIISYFWFLRPGKKARQQHYCSKHQQSVSHNPL